MKHIISFYFEILYCYIYLWLCTDGSFYLKKKKCRNTFPRTVE